jgi:hypothetical protein
MFCGLLQFLEINVGTQRRGPIHTSLNMKKQNKPGEKDIHRRNRQTKQGQAKTRKTHKQSKN